jgi:hypothetical protein
LLFTLLAFVPGDRNHAYRWWMVAGLAAFGVGIVVEWRAIRWHDRAEDWPPE